DDFRNGIVEARWQVEGVCFPIARQVLRSTVDRAVLFDPARTADADEGRELEPVLFGALDQFPQHLDQLIDGLVAAELFVAVAPQLEFPDGGLGKVRRLLQIQFDDFGADVRAADVKRQYRLGALRLPRRDE